MLLALLSMLSSGAPAQVYKWTDENGVVNYGDKPPASRKSAKPLPDNGGTVSVVPGISKDEMQQIRERDMQRRVQQLEQEVDDLRARSRDAAVPYSVPAEVYVPAYAYGYDYGYWRRRPPIARHHPGSRPEHPHVTPHKPRSGKGGPIEAMPGAPSARGGRG
jgi:hypothetical protein